MSAGRTITLEELAPTLGRLGNELQRLDLTRAFKGMALILESETKRNFQESHDPDGNAWEQLKHKRNRERDQRGSANAQAGDSQKPLLDSGLLEASCSAAGEHHVQEITSASLVWGSNLDYAGVHQEGATINRPEQTRDSGAWVFEGADGETVFTRRIKAHSVTIPARPFLGINDAITSQVQELLAEEVLRQLGVNWP